MRRPGGFTLIEVLVSLIIVALGMGALLATLTSAADSTNFLRDKTFASWIALNRIAEQRLRGVMPDVGKTDGEVEYANRTWRWQQEVLNVDIPGLVRIDVSVREDLPPRPGTNEKDQPWIVTMSGIMGNAIATAPATPGSPTVDWNGTVLPNAPPPGTQDDGSGSASGAGPGSSPAGTSSTDGPGVGDGSTSGGSTTGGAASGAGADLSRGEGGS